MVLASGLTLMSMNSSSSDRNREELLAIIRGVRVSREGSVDDTVLLQRFEDLLPGTDISNLCESDYDDDTIADICLGVRDAENCCTRAELLELVRKLQATESGNFETEGASVNAVLKFNYNCRHPAKSDLIFYVDEHFDGQAYPPPEDIVSKALGEK